MNLILPAWQSRFRLLLCLFSFFSMAGTRAQAPTLLVHKGLPGDTTKQIVYGSGIYLAVVLHPLRFYASADGVSWGPVTTPDFGRSINIQPVLAYGAGLFVCLADSGKIFTSPDGATWTRRHSGKRANFMDIQFLQGAFYAVGDSATFLHSANGIDWNALSTGKGAPTDSYIGIAYGNGYTAITATSLHAGRVLYRSGAGTLHSWTADTIATINNLKFEKDHFYSFGDSVRISTDAVTWTTLSFPSTGIGRPITSGFYDGSRVYLLSNTYYNGGYYVGEYISTDGITFAPGIIIKGQVIDGLYANHHYFIYGIAGTAISSDGVNYQVAGANYNALASNGHGYVGVGAASNGGYVFTSPDFSTWTESTQSALNGFYSIVYDGTRYVTAGDGSVWASPDGAVLTYLGPLPIRNVDIPPITTVTYGAGQYVGLGFGLYGANDVLSTSTDGSYWYTITHPLAVSRIMKVKFVNGYFFAMADSFNYNNITMSPSLLASTNGNDWVNVTPHLPFMVEGFSDIVYDSSKYYVIGMEGNVNTGTTTGFFSVSTANITNPDSYGAKGTVTTPPEGAILRGSSFAYSHGHFVGGATDINTPGNGYLLYSTDGLHWNNTPLGILYGDAIGNIPSGDTFRLLTHSNVRITAIFGVPPPITLLDFDARIEHRSTLLSWEIAQEENISRFTVQRSPDGLHWDSIGVVAAAGQKNPVEHYRFVDGSPQKGYDYYRLILTDINGRQQISPVRWVFFGEDEEERDFRVYPNPARGNCTLELPQSGAGVATLYNPAGAEVLRQVFNGYTVTLSLQGLPAGVYHLRVQQNRKRYNKELLHQ
ncbi:MAG TPA: T9SS type A sorting domain-containing protein [Puia sp.]